MDQPGIGFFGGSFDPPHQGHLQIAEQAIETANLEKLIFCPAFHAPMKDSPPMFSGKQRLAMLKAMCAKNPLMQITDIEIVHAKTRYTYETIFELRQNFPNHLIYLILEPINLSITLVKQIKDLAKMVTFLVFARDKDECARLNFRILK